jgi:hypothetical protein
MHFIDSSLKLAWPFANDCTTRYQHNALKIHNNQLEGIKKKKKRRHGSKMKHTFTNQKKRRLVFVRWFLHPKIVRRRNERTISQQKTKWKQKCIEVYIQDKMN